MARERFTATCDEHYIAEDKGTPVATARMLPFEQNIRGVWKKTCGIGMVASAPEYRRRGHVRDMILRALIDAQSEGYGTSSLYPFKDSFYMALGYVKMPPVGALEFDPGKLRSRSCPSGYTVKRVEGDDGKKVWISLHSEAVQQIHGAIRRSEKRWAELIKYSKAKMAVAYGPESRPEGVMVYGIKGYGEGHDWAETGRIGVREMFWSNYTARDALLSFLYMHVDQVVKVSVPCASIHDDYYQWISGVHTPSYSTKILPMSRIVDVEEALSGIPVRHSGEVVLGVEDAQLKSNAGTYIVTSKDGSLAVDRTKKKADTKLTIEGLTALLYGTLSVEQIRSLGWVSGPAPATLVEWLPRATPWLIEDF
jgi:predicted acetyltransferase